MVATDGIEPSNTGLYRRLFMAYVASCAGLHHPARMSDTVKNHCEFAVQIEEMLKLSV